MVYRYLLLVSFLATLNSCLAQLSETGQWGEIIQFPVIPVGAYVVPEYPVSNRLLVYSSNEADSFGPGGRTLFGEYNSVDGSVSGREVAETGHNMFCPGMSSLADGSLLITGGENATVTTRYDPSTNSFNVAPPMQLARGYQTSVTLSNGQVFTIGGSYTPIDRGEDKMGEIFDPATNEWTLLPGVSSRVILTNDQEGIFRSDNHPWLFPWRDGTVFHAGPSTSMHWFTTSSRGTVQEAGTRDDQDAMSGIHVMYDVGQIFSAGGSPNYGNSPALANAHLISISEPGEPANVEVLSGLNEPRVFSGGTVLPDGTILITGGQRFARLFNDAEAVLAAELFDPSSRTFTLLASETEARTYHSVALLLADGTVFSGGGGLCGNCGEANHFTGQIFSPPYLFSGDEPAARPVITDLSSETVSPGGQLTVSMDTDGSPPAISFAFVRIGSATHAVNSDQRRIPLEITGGEGGEIVLAIPSDSGIVIPGPYFLFAISEDGVPSVSRTVSVQI